MVMFSSNTCSLCGCEIEPYCWDWSYVPDKDGQITSLAACDVCADQTNLNDLEW